MDSNTEEKMIIPFVILLLPHTMCAHHFSVTKSLFLSLSVFLSNRSLLFILCVCMILSNCNCYFHGLFIVTGLKCTYKLKSAYNCQLICQYFLLESCEWPRMKKNDMIYNDESGLLWSSIASMIFTIEGKGAFNINSMRMCEAIYINPTLFLTAQGWEAAKKGPHQWRAL